MESILDDDPPQLYKPTFRDFSDRPQPLPAQQLIDWIDKVHGRKSIGDTRLACWDGTRKVDLSFNATFSRDETSAITTKNRLYLFPVGGYSTPKMPLMGRFLTIRECARVMGVELDSLSGLSGNQVRLSLGNAFAVNMCGVVLREIMSRFCVFERQLLTRALGNEGRIRLAIPLKEVSRKKARTVSTATASSSDTMVETGIDID